MSVPGIVEDALDGEEVLSRVSIGGDDQLLVTPERTLVYRAGGMLSDESVESYSHGVDRLLLSEGRRKSTLTFEYAVDDPAEVTLHNAHVDEALQPILASVLRNRKAIDDDERFLSAFRFSELTLVVTSQRLLKHVGAAVWDGEYDAYQFEDVTGLDYERGEVATGVVLTVDGRKQRIKTPNDRLPEVQQPLESALFGYHDVSSADQLGEDEDDPEERSEDREPEEGADPMDSFGEGIDPLDAGGGPGADAPADVGSDPLIDGTTEEPSGSSDPPGGESPGTATDRSDPDRADPTDATAGGDREPRSRPERDRQRSDAGDREAPHSGGRREDPPASERRSDQPASERREDHPAAERANEPSADRPDRGRGDAPHDQREASRRDRQPREEPPRQSWDDHRPQEAQNPRQSRASGDTRRRSEARSTPDADPLEEGKRPTDERRGGGAPDADNTGERTTPAGDGSTRDRSGSDGGPGDGSDGSTTDERVETPFTEEFEPASDDYESELREEVEELREAVERQNELLAKQRDAIERLVEELRE